MLESFRNGGDSLQHHHHNHGGLRQASSEAYQPSSQSYFKVAQPGQSDQSVQNSNSLQFSPLNLDQSFAQQSSAQPGTDLANLANAVNAGDMTTAMQDVVTCLEDIMQELGLIDPSTTDTQSTSSGATPDTGSGSGSSSGDGQSQGSSQGSDQGAGQGCGGSDGQSGSSSDQQYSHHHHHHHHHHREGGGGGGQGQGSGSGDGQGQGGGSGDGQGQGSGSGDGQGQGSGSGDGQGQGSGSRDGQGQGSGSGDGQGQGSGSGDGQGQGSGSGDGQGQGSGSGDGQSHHHHHCGDGQGQGGSSGSGDGQGQGSGSGQGNDRQTGQKDLTQAAQYWSQAVTDFNNGNEQGAANDLRQFETSYDQGSTLLRNSVLADPNQTPADQLIMKGLSQTDNERHLADAILNGGMPMADKVQNFPLGDQLRKQILQQIGGQLNNGMSDLNAGRSTIASGVSLGSTDNGGSGDGSGTGNGNNGNGNNGDGSNGAADPEGRANGSQNLTKAAQDFSQALTYLRNGNEQGARDSLGQFERDYDQGSGDLRNAVLQDPNQTPGDKLINSGLSETDQVRALGDAVYQWFVTDQHDKLKKLPGGSDIANQILQQFQTQMSTALGALNDGRGQIDSGINIDNNG